MFNHKDKGILYVLSAADNEANWKLTFKWSDYFPSEELLQFWYSLHYLLFYVLIPRQKCGHHYPLHFYYCHYLYGGQNFPFWMKKTIKTPTKNLTKDKMGGNQRFGAICWCWNVSCIMIGLLSELCQRSLSWWFLLTGNNEGLCFVPRDWLSCHFGAEFVYPRFLYC